MADLLAVFDGDSLAYHAMPPIWTHRGQFNSDAEDSLCRCVDDSRNGSEDRVVSVVPGFAQLIEPMFIPKRLVDVPMLVDRPCVRTWWAFRLISIPRILIYAPSD